MTIPLCIASIFAKRSIDGQRIPAQASLTSRSRGALRRQAHRSRTFCRSSNARRRPAKIVDVSAHVFIEKFRRSRLASDRDALMLCSHVARTSCVYRLRQRRCRTHTGQLCIGRIDRSIPLHFSRGPSQSATVLRVSLHGVATKCRGRPSSCRLQRSEVRVKNRRSTIRQQ
jgi:hypothetical protein